MSAKPRPRERKAEYKNGWIDVVFFCLIDEEVRPSFFYFLFYRFLQQVREVRVGGRNKNKNRIHSDHFPIELKSKEHEIVFPSILIQLENDPKEFYFYFTN